MVNIVTNTNTVADSSRPAFTKATDAKATNAKAADAKIENAQQASTQQANTQQASTQQASTQQVNIEQTDTEQLKQAIAHNDIATVKALIKAGVDLRPAQWDETPGLVIAAEKGHLEIIKMLVAANANVNNGYTQLPLHSAAANGHLEIVKCLLEAGAYIHAQNGRGYTALMCAATAGQLTIVQFLYSQGANLGTPGTAETALTLAQKAKQLDVCQFLAAGTQAAAQATTATPSPAGQPPSSALPTSSVMDELIASTTAELNELLMDNT
ncbi:MAG: ankyrin repeat domain-containing protein [Cyanobacteria bacterium J06621_3]